MLERKLGGVERQFNQQNLIGSTHFCSVLFIQGAWDCSRLPLALARLCLVYPRLLARIVADPYPRFAPLLQPAELPCRVLQRANPEHWRAVAEQEMHRSYAEEKGLAFLHLLQGTDASELLLSMHHSLADGLSGLAVLQKLVKLLADPQHSVQAAPMGEALEERLPKKYQGKPGLLRALYFVLRMLKQSPKQVLHLSQESAFTKTTRSSGWELDEAETMRLKDLFKQQGSNLMSGLCAASILALYQGWQDQDSCWVSLNTPANLRGKLPSPVPAEEMGLFISGIVTWYSLKKTTTVFELARAVHQSIGKSLDRGDPFCLALLGAGARIPRPPQGGRLAHRFRPTFSLSNQGVIPEFDPMMGASVTAYRSLVALWPQDHLAIVMQSYKNRLLVDNLVSKEKLPEHFAEDFQKRQRTLLSHGS